MIRTETRIQYAAGYLDLGMLKEATRELKEISQDDADLPQVTALWIRVYLERRYWRKMERASKELVRRIPKDVFGWVNWAYALREMNRHAEAKAVAFKGLKLHPKEAVLWFNLACYCSLLEEVEEASGHLDTAISLDKEFEAEAVDDPDLDNLWTWLRSSSDEG